MRCLKSEVVVVVWSLERKVEWVCVWRGDQETWAVVWSLERKAEWVCVWRGSQET